LTVGQAIGFVDEVKPNAFSQGVKLRWLSQLEGRLALEVFLMSPEEAEADYAYTADDLGKTLLVSMPYDDLYTWWLQAQIDLANGEYDKARNTMAVFNAAWTAFVCWFCQRYDPAQGYEEAT
jgi:hypothetical protein